MTQILRAYLVAMITSALGVTETLVRPAIEQRTPTTISGLIAGLVSAVLPFVVARLAHLAPSPKKPEIEPTPNLEVEDGGRELGQASGQAAAAAAAATAALKKAKP